MQYLSSYYWQQEESARTCLILQQLIHRKGKVPVLFSCICTDTQGGAHEGNVYFVEQLTEWFRTKGQELLWKSRKENFTAIEKAFLQKTDQIEREYVALKELSAIGLLCIEDYFLLFQWGNTGAYLLNTGFNHSHCKTLVAQGNTEITVQSGKMEKNIGILLVSEDFCNKLSKQQLEECLSVKEIHTSQKCARRLEELGREAERKGGRHMGAVFLVTG